MTTQKSVDTSVEGMAQLVRQVEMQQMQFQLEARFRKNMEVFRELSPEIYHEFVDYEATDLRLSFSEKGYLELVNYNLNLKPVYAIDPVEFSKQQVEDFIKRPSISSISIMKSDIWNPAHIHVPLMNRLIDETVDYTKEIKAHCKSPIGMMLMTGCGLGYQIHNILEKTDIHHLVIFDPHKDSFYAALHVVDWLPILQHFCRHGHMLKFFIGVSPRDAMANMRLLTDKIGLHNIVYTYLYRHFSSKEEEEFIQMYRKEFHLNASGVGFFDDEQVSLSHTIHNLNRGTKLFIHDTSARDLPPAFIVGNGPSLDEHIEFIREHAPNAIVFSCGTALGSLAKKNIKPDFQVEMERNINIVDWIELGTTPEYRKGITLLTLNTVAPAALDLFDDACIARKPNDIGEQILDSVIEKNPAKALQVCNPTVTNAALSYALSMGFKEIYFLGVDLGTRADGAHHSSLSLYNDYEEKKDKQTDTTLFDYSVSKYKIKGNFVDEVDTNPFLDNTRINLELLLRHFQSTVGGINCYNPNNGAYINGVTPTKKEDLRISSTIEDKEKLIDKLKNKHFHKPVLETVSMDDVNSLLETFFRLCMSIKLPEKVKDIAELYSIMDDIYLTVQKLPKNDHISKLLLRGSINGYFAILMKAVQFSQSREEFDQAYQSAKSAYNEFLEKAFKIMVEDPLKLDDTHDIVAATLRKKSNS